MDYKKIRVLHIIPNLKKGGAERLLINIASEINKREDAECLIAVLNEGNDYTELTNELPIELCTSKVNLSITRGHKANVAHYIEIVNKYKPHIIHSHLFEAELLSRWHLFPNIKYVSHIHNNEKQLRNFSFSTFFNKELFTNFYEKKFILDRYKKCTNHFLAISKTTETYLQKTLPASFHKKIIYLPNAIDYDAFFYEFKNTVAPKHKLVTIGRLDTNKNHTFLINVVKKLNHYTPIELDIYGAGPNEKNIRKAIISNNLEDKIKLLGISDFIEKELEKYSLYIHSAKHESFGLVLLEAMASGLPVVTLNGGGNEEIMINGKNGFIINEANVNLFAEKIIEIVSNEKLYKEMSIFSQNFAKQYDIKAYVEKLLRFYNKIMT